MSLLPNLSSAASISRFVSPGINRCNKIAKAIPISGIVVTAGVIWLLWQNRSLRACKTDVARQQAADNAGHLRRARRAREETDAAIAEVRAQLELRSQELVTRGVTIIKLMRAVAHREERLRSIERSAPVVTKGLMKSAATLRVALADEQRVGDRLFADLVHTRWAMVKVYLLAEARRRLTTRKIKVWRKLNRDLLKGRVSINLDTVVKGKKREVIEEAPAAKIITTVATQPHATEPKTIKLSALTPTRAWAPPVNIKLVDGKGLSFPVHKMVEIWKRNTRATAKANKTLLHEGHVLAEAAHWLRVGQVPASWLDMDVQPAVKEWLAERKPAARKQRANPDQARADRRIGTAVSGVRRESPPVHTNGVVVHDKCCTVVDLIDLDYTPGFFDEEPKASTSTVAPPAWLGSHVQRAPAPVDPEAFPALVAAAKARSEELVARGVTTARVTSNELKSVAAKAERRALNAGKSDGDFANTRGA